MLKQSCCPYPAPSQEYEGADTEKKRMILDKLSDYGVKNCSWIHSLEHTSNNVEKVFEGLTTNFLTRTAHDWCILRYRICL